MREGQGQGQGQGHRHRRQRGSAQRHDGDGACTCPQPRAPARARRPAACMCGSSSWLLQARKFNTLGRLFCRRCVRREALRASERGEARHGAGRGRGRGAVTRLPSHCSLGRCVGGHTRAEHDAVDGHIACVALACHPHEAHLARARRQRGLRRSPRVDVPNPGHQGCVCQ